MKVEEVRQEMCIRDSSTLETKRKQMELVCRDVSLAIFLETGYDKIRVKTSGGAEG